LLARCGPNRRSVFLEATAAPANATPQELPSNPVIECNSLGDFVGVNTELFTDVPDIVDQANFCGEKAIVCIFDHLRSAGIGFNNGRVTPSNEWFEYRLHVF
jgi:hypothetical protein